MDLDVSVDDHAGCTVVAVVGEIDIYTVPLLREALDAMFAAGTQVTVVVDLTAVSFVDSAGLGFLVASFKKARTAGGALHLAGVQPITLRLFQITGVDKVVPIHDDLQGAIAAASRRGGSAVADVPVGAGAARKA